MCIKKKNQLKMNQNDREERFIGRSSVVLAHASVPVRRSYNFEIVINKIKINVFFK